MSPDEKPISDLTALEAALASLAPRADGLDRERLMFLTGQASAAPPPSARVRMWQAAFAAMTAVAASLLVALVVQPRPQAVERLVPVATEPNAPRLIPADHEPAPLPDGSMPVQVAGKNNGIESAPAWPWDSLLRGRSDWRQRQLAHAGLSRVVYGRLLDQVPEEGIRATIDPGTSGDRVPTIETSPVSYRDMLDSMLKESGAQKAERRS